MWICIRCQREIPFPENEPGIDSFGIYVLCPHCQRRNTLINVGKRGQIALAQAPERKARRQSS